MDEGRDPVSEIRIFPRAGRIDPGVLARFAAVAASNVSDVMRRRGAAVGIRPVGESLSVLSGRSVVGPALTVLTRPGDNLAVHKALDIAEPGDVVVVDAQRDPYSSILGDLLTHYARSRGVAALVVDGAVRDSKGISGGGLPVFARSISHVAPTKAGPGDIGCPVSIGGTVVRDGDLIIGDDDGVTVVPREDVDAVLVLAEQLVADEDESMARIDAGTWDRSWVDRAATITVIDGETAGGDPR
jgi:regulator of RNase E activity RraA